MGRSFHICSQKSFILKGCLLLSSTISSSSCSRLFADVTLFVRRVDSDQLCTCTRSALLFLQSTDVLESFLLVLKKTSYIQSVCHNQVPVHDSLVSQTALSRHLVSFRQNAREGGVTEVLSERRLMPQLSRLLSSLRPVGGTGFYLSSAGQSVLCACTQTSCSKS